MWQTFRKVNSAAPLSPVWTNGYTYRSSLPSRNPVFWMFCYLPPKEATFLSSDGGVLKFKIQDLITYRQMQCSDILRISPIFLIPCIFISAYSSLKLPEISVNDPSLKYFKFGSTSIQSTQNQRPPNEEECLSSHWFVFILRTLGLMRERRWEAATLLTRSVVSTEPQVLYLNAY